MKHLILIPLILITLSLPMMPKGEIERPDNRGFRFIQNFKPKEYQHPPQNWFLLQDERGIIYIANQGGILTYNGKNWDEIQLPNLTARSLAIDDSGVVYCGGINEVGFIDCQTNGTAIYVSLLNKLKLQHRDFSYVWKSHSTPKGIYFRTSKFIFRWHPGTQLMKSWEPQIKGASFKGSFVCNDRLYVRQHDLGLIVMEDDFLKPVPGGEIFAQTGIYAMFPYDGKHLLIGTRDKGFFIFDGIQIKPFATELDDYVKKNKLSFGIAINSRPGLFALTTLSGGMVIMDKKGRSIAKFDKKAGLQDENVKFVMEDTWGNLWLALNKGISKIEFNSPISIYDKRSKLEGIVQSVTRHGHKSLLFVGMTEGVYFQNLKKGNTFQQIQGIPGMCYSLLSTGNSLLAATSDGVFQVNFQGDKYYIRQVTHTRANFLLHPEQGNHIVWVGTSQGLYYIERINGIWTETEKINQIEEEIISIEYNKKGNLWLGTLTKGAIKVDISTVRPGLKSSNISIIKYDSTHGLPRGETRLSWAAGHIIAATKLGLYQFDPELDKFVPDFTLGKEFSGGSKKVFLLSEDQNKNIWFQSNFKKLKAVYQADGSFDIQSTSFLRFPLTQVNGIYHDPNNIDTWFATHKGLIRFDNTSRKNYQLEFRALVQELDYAYDKSTIYDGGIFIHPSKKSPVRIPHIKYMNRNLRFLYSAAFYEGQEFTQFQVFLEGFDESWSKWTQETKKDYTNLYEGLYTFRVRARNVYKTVGTEDRIQFRVLPPWYRTWWAYIIYLTLLALGIFFIVNFRSKKLIREKFHLEQIVHNRTGEIKAKNRQLEEQSEKLKEMDRVKSRFFANISHEFRTPLTLITGPLEQVLEENKDRKLAETVDMALQNSQRLLTLINQLLDLSKLDSGKIKLNISQTNVIPLLKGRIHSFQSLVAQKDLTLSFYSQKENLMLYVDEEKLERIIVNLISNAMKFTPPGGNITVATTEHLKKSIDFPNGFLQISVSDTGVGISEDQIPYIFDRFYQAQENGSRQLIQKGTGIGLALVKELIQLHQGDISVASKKGKGSTFSIRLPFGDHHFSYEDLRNEAKPVTKYKLDINVDDMHIIQGQQLQPEIKEIDNIDNGKEVILVVEDNPDVRKYIRGPLKKDYRIIEAANGEIGVQKAREVIPDLIISDVMMPCMDGYQMCDILKKDIATSHIPIILLTAKASEESVIEGLETGADDYVTKPFNTKILLTRIKNLIELRKGLQNKIQRDLMLQPTEINVSSIDQDFMQQLKNVLNKNISKSEFKIDMLAEQLYMSRSTLNRKIRALTGESSNHFIQSYRLKRAAQLLKDNFGNVTQVAYEVGFTSSAYFTKCFKEKFHQLPNAYANN
jgi:signal transduction histidine kinase/DNA-binding response OmpR family regulator